jgi:uncharacterized membrane protein
MTAIFDSILIVLVVVGVFFVLAVAADYVERRFPW